MKMKLIEGRVAKGVYDRVGLVCMVCSGSLPGEVTYWDKNEENKDMCVDIWEDHLKQREQKMVKMGNERCLRNRRKASATGDEQTWGREL